MTEIKVKDEGGATISMVDFGDYRSSKFGIPLAELVEINRTLPEFKFRDGDILLCSYPKAGCTWTFEILTMLMKGKPEGPELSKMTSMLEASSQGVLDAMTSPRILNTHLPYRRIPPDLHKKKVKVLLVVRNPKDLAVSLYNMMCGFKHYNYDGSFQDWFPLFIRGDLAYDTYWKYYRDWEVATETSDLDVMTLYFEEMKRDTRRHVKNLADFLDFPVAEDLISDIADKCQFQSMKDRYTPKMLGAGVYKRDSTVGFMRKGEVGDWRTWFTVTQDQVMDCTIDREMGGSNLRMIYQL